MRRGARDAVERRAARVARRCARLVLALKRDGELAAAAKLEQAAVEAVEQLRKEAV